MFLVKIYFDVFYLNKEKPNVPHWYIYFQSLGFQS